MTKNNGGIVRKAIHFNVEIRTAYAAGFDSNQSFMLTQHRVLNVLDLQKSPSLLCFDECFHPFLAAFP